MHDQQKPRLDQALVQLLVSFFAHLLDPMFIRLGRDDVNPSVPPANPKKPLSINGFFHFWVNQFFEIKFPDRDGFTFLMVSRFVYFPIGLFCCVTLRVSS